MCSYLSELFRDKIEVNGTVDTVHSKKGDCMDTEGVGYRSSTYSRKSGTCKKVMRILLLVVILLCMLYFALVYYLVSVALVPSFAEKLEIFQEITEKSYAEQIQTFDILDNRYEALSETREWLLQVDSVKWKTISEDGYELVATEFLQPKESHKWVLVLHGYTGWKEEMYPFAYWYFQQGYHVVVPDLRCQGESEGDFIGMGWTDHFDCRLWLDHMLEKDPDAQIVLHGQSMGASTALILSGAEWLPENVKAVISDCAYTDAYSMFGDKITDWFHLPPFPFVDSARVMLKLRGGYDLKAASAINAVQVSRTPTLLIHGAEDALIDVSMAYALYDAAACDKELLIIAGAGHAQAQDKDPEGYFGAIEQFLKKYVVQP